MFILSQNIICIGCKELITFEKQSLEICAYETSLSIIMLRGLSRILIAAL